ncbi:MAG: hypothetical protein QM811_22570 [Pirellulales bacterium]
MSGAAPSAGGDPPAPEPYLTASPGESYGDVSFLINDVADLIGAVYTLEKSSSLEGPFEYVTGGTIESDPAGVVGSGFDPNTAYYFRAAIQLGDDPLINTDLVSFTTRHQRPDSASIQYFTPVNDNTYTLGFQIIPPGSGQYTQYRIAWVVYIDDSPNRADVFENTTSWEVFGVDAPVGSKVELFLSTIGSGGETNGTPSDWIEATGEINSVPSNPIITDEGGGVWTMELFGLGNPQVDFYVYADGNNPPTMEYYRDPSRNEGTDFLTVDASEYGVGNWVQIASIGGDGVKRFSERKQVT